MKKILLLIVVVLTMILGACGLNSNAYTDFSSKEKQILNTKLGEIIPFIESEDYQLKVEDDYIYYYAKVSSKQKFDNYRMTLVANGYTNEGADAKGVYTYSKGKLTLKVSFVENTIHVYIYGGLNNAPVIPTPEEGVVSIKSILEEAATLENGKTLSGTRKTVGTVKSFIEAYTTQYKNVSFILTDGESEIKVWRAKGDCAASLAIGDKVYVEGEIINYGGNIELQEGKLTTGNESNTPAAPVELTTIAEVLKAASGLADGSALPTPYKTSGVVSNFEKKSSYNGGDYYQFQLVDGDNKILVYKPVGAIVESIKNGDTVYVKGTVKNYKGTIEFDGAEVSYGDDFDKTNVEKLTEEEKTPVIPSEVTGTYDFISLPMAIAIAMDGGSDFQSTEKYYITGWVSNVNNYSYGSITITDGNVEIFAYGITSYANNGVWPLEGDVVVLEAVVGTNGTDVELKNATRLVEWHDVAVNEREYTSATVTEARNANAGDKLIVEGVVAAFTYKNAKTSTGEYVRDGFYLVSGGDSILIHGTGVSSAVELGNTVKVAGVKEYFVQESEISLAAKYGFPGANQLSQAQLISSDKKVTDITNNNFEEATMKELMSCSYDENITNQIFKVRAVIKKVPGNGFVNYYINDLDLTTGTYTYTKCNGSDFAWLDKYLNADGQYFCELLVTVCNAKATASGCLWRVIPVAILGDAAFSVEEETLDFVFDYFVAPQFEEVYYANPNIELLTNHSSSFLGYSNVTIDYVSADENVVKVIEVEGKKVLDVVAVGSTTVDITLKMGDKTLVKTITITRDAEPTFEAKTVAETIATTLDTTVTVAGIVGPSLVNQTGFYLIDETGVIAVRTNKEVLATLKQGNSVVLEGTRAQNRATETMPGQAMVNDAVVVHNYYGEHEYSTASFQNSTLEELAKHPTTEDWTSKAFFVEATAYASGYVAVIKNGATEIVLYVSGATQYKWLTDIAAQYPDQLLKMEVALCNWNEKNPYKAAVLAVYLPDGTKVINSLNFS